LITGTATVLPYRLANHTGGEAEPARKPFRVAYEAEVGFQPPDNKCEGGKFA